MKKRVTLVLLVVLTLVLLSACGPQPLPEEPTSIPTLAPATLPAATATEASPAGEGTVGGEATPAGSGDQVAAGQQVFEQNCSVCHNLTTETKVGPGLAGLFSLEQLPNGQPVNEDNLREWITTGGGGMPAIPLNDTDLTAVIAFLKDATQ